MLLALLALGAVLSLSSPVFLTKENLLNVTRTVSINGVAAAGMTLVILTGGIDLSVGSLFALAGAVTTGLLGTSYTSAPLARLLALPMPVAVLVGVAVAGLLGYVNGWVITKFAIPPFVATLGMMSFARGLTYLYTGGYPITFNVLPPMFAWLGQGHILGVPVPTVVFLLAVLLCWWILRFTSFGRAIYAVGGNAETARLSGLNVKRVKRLAYTFVGALAGISGIVLASRVAAGSPVAGLGYETDVIAGVVIGGTSLMGGSGSILGTVIGVFIIGVIENGLNLLGVSTYYQYIVKGLVLILAAGLDGYIRKRRPH
ncbi:MAG: ABC transporter permease [Betaproteobacteria bacterium]